MVPCLLEQTLQDLFRSVALPRARVLMCSLESCQERSSPASWFVFSLLIRRRGLIMAPSSRSPASWGLRVETALKAQTICLSHFQTKAKRSHLVWCCLCHAPWPDRWYCPSNIKERFPRDMLMAENAVDRACSSPWLIATAPQWQQGCDSCNSMTGEVTCTQVAQPVHAPHKATLTRKVTLETCKTNGRIDT